MMKFINPLSVNAKTSLVNGIDKTAVIQVEFCYQIVLFTCLLNQPVNGFFDFLQDMFGAEILNGMYRIHPQGINMKIPEPHERILCIIPAHGIAPGIIKINGIAPGRFIFFGKIGAKFIEVITLWPNVVIHYIEYYR